MGGHPPPPYGKIENNLRRNMQRLQRVNRIPVYRLSPPPFPWLSRPPAPIFDANPSGRPMRFFWMLFSWWRGATYGTLLTTWLYGRPAGTDGIGNRYYQSKNGKRRWVLYNGTVEASRVPAEWHGWLHHTFKDPPRGPALVRPWEKDHLPNMSGTKGAYYPPGSLARGGVRAPATGDYEPWRPA